jgi:hypothetical protein
VKRGALWSNVPRRAKRKILQRDANALLLFRRAAEVIRDPRGSSHILLLHTAVSRADPIETFLPTVDTGTVRVRDDIPEMALFIFMHCG